MVKGLVELQIAPNPKPGPIASGHPVALGSASTVHSLPAAPHRPKRIETEGQQAGAVSTFQALVSRKKVPQYYIYDNELFIEYIMNGLMTSIV